eukprot:CAMPEP_0117551250 /NCGR_PEP_ID=MMETSP0784-20121206/49098_1 /TAXON_ID=39447 /ORGANISM="" /LENGTH=56 /DNA_ID=CAMNT_0005348291 /DNA_START=111 /DNA_END=278 /DNA_ORIENTATION=-
MANDRLHQCVDFELETSPIVFRLIGRAVSLARQSCLKHGPQMPPQKGADTRLYMSM